MSISVAGARRPQRVRHQARQALELMAFSATVSVGLSFLLVVLVMLGRQG
jgi:hypothetical protein